MAVERPNVQVFTSEVASWPTAQREQTLRKVARRLIPVMCICYFLAYIDRTNIGIAALTMNDDLGITATAFGLGAGLFFAGYVLFEVPSNLVMHRVGARIWMSRIMITWGIVATCTAFIQGESSFFVIRFLLGVAEAGFFPGMILYLTYWFPAEQRARMTGMFMAAVPLSTALGAPLGGLLLGLDGFGGLSGWQWIFIVEGVPSILLGVFLFKLLPDRPSTASFLTPDERVHLTKEIESEGSRVRQRHDFGIAKSILHPRVLALSLVYFSIAFGLYGLAFWMPQIIKASLAIDSNLLVSLLTAAPYALGAVAMIYWGRRCDRLRRPARFTALPLLIGGVALAASAFLTDAPWLGYLGLCACAIGVLAAFPAFWTLPTAFLTGVTAAAGIATVNSLGNVSGFVGPYWVGAMTDLFGSAQWGLVTIGVVMVLGSIVVSILGDTPGQPARSTR
ncbi:MAG: MFS transporter [Geodermatophilaceae bacterium]